MINTAVLGLGSNIRAKENIEEARKIIAEKFIILKESSFIFTDPVGLKEQPPFLNGTILITTHLDYLEVLRMAKNIEDTLGRIRSDDKFGPRTIDIDLIVWNDTIIDEDFYERDFLKQTTLEVLPELKF